MEFRREDGALKAGLARVTQVRFVVVDIVDTEDDCLTLSGLRTLNGYELALTAAKRERK